MPLYEGIGLVGDKHAVVCDIGAAYARLGFAGEQTPRVIVPSNVYRWREDIHYNTIDYSRDEAEQYEVIAEFMHDVYYKHLLVNPKDRRIVLVESVLCPTKFRNLLARVMFERFEVPALCFVPSHLMACLPLGQQNALIMDIGHNECMVSPVFEGVVMLHSSEVAPLGARAIHERIRELLQESDVKLNGTNETAKLKDMTDVTLSDDVVEDIKVRTCFVQPIDVGERVCPDVEYPLQDSGHTLVISGAVRQSAAEVLFEPDVDDRSIVSLVLDAILRCPIDLRKMFAEHMLVVDGSAMLPGFLARLKAELLQALASDRYKEKLPLSAVRFYKPPFGPINCTAWLGASIFGALEILPHRSITRESYAENPKKSIPDWTSFEGNRQEGEQQR